MILKVKRLLQISDQLPPLMASLSHFKKSGKTGLWTGLWVTSLMSVQQVKASVSILVRRWKDNLGKIYIREETCGLKSNRVSCPTGLKLAIHSEREKPRVNVVYTMHTSTYSIKCVCS